MKSKTTLASITLISLMLLFSLVSQRAAAQEHRLQAPRTVIWKDFLGVNAQFLWFAPERYQQQIERLQALGLQWVRLDLHWDRLETAENQYQLADLDHLVRVLDESQLKSVFYLVGSARFITSAPFYSPYQDQYPPRDPDVFSQRMAMLALRYPSVDAWQVWNEPNLLGFWRPQADAAGYAKLLQSSATALRQVAPDKPVIAAGMAFFSDLPGGALMFDQLGALHAEQLQTVAAYHPYTQLPEGNQSGSDDFIARAKILNSNLRAAGVPAIWATEWGWSSYAGPKEAQDLIGVNGQADYTLRRLALMATQDYDRVFLFTLNDLDARASVRDQDYGLLNLDGQPKPVYLALQRFLQRTGPSLKPEMPPQLEATVDDLYSIAWTRADGSHLWMFWAKNGGEVQLSPRKNAILYDPLNGKETPMSNNQRLTVRVKPTLQMLTWE